MDGKVKSRTREPYYAIKYFLSVNNISQSDLGEAIGKTKTDINKRLNGTGPDFRLTEARALSREFGIPYEYFFKPIVPLKDRQSQDPST